MIENKDIVFVTTTLYTKWLGYQQRIIKDLFPDSEIIVIDGRINWPNSWFYWIDEIKRLDKKYYIHIDEDFFITSKDEVLKAINKMESNSIDLIGCSDGYHQFRGANPVAINTFLMIGKIDKIKDIKKDLKSSRYYYTDKGWLNDFGLSFNNRYLKDFEYKFEKQGESNFKIEQEPYYAFLWEMKEIGSKFDYLYPHFDDRFKSTNPRLEKNSPDIGIHMWYTRQWDSNMYVWGMKNIDRYNRIENYILNEKSTH